MSFILEALRKSESDRQRLGNVTLADLPVARRHRGQPWWVFALSGLLLVNIAVLALVLLRDKPPPPSPSSNVSPISAPNDARTTQPAPHSAPASAAVTDNPLQEAAAQIAYETVPASELEIANAAASVPEGQTLVRPIDALRGDPNGQQSSANRSAAASPTTSQETSQELRIDLHVFSNNARERFVLINMRRYTEGQQLPSGAMIEQITPAGVVLYQNGTRYQLNR